MSIFFKSKKAANSAAHLRPGRDTQPNNEVHLASLPQHFRHRSPAKQQSAFGVPPHHFRHHSPAKQQSAFGVPPHHFRHRSPAKQQSAFGVPPHHFRHRSPAKQQSAFGVPLSQRTLPEILPSQTAKRIWRPSLPTTPGSHTLPGGCPPRGPRRGNVNRGMKSLNRYAPLGAHL